ncbi:MAG: hypothetical protein RXO36_06845 [Candidatus Nanopusillus acidilobi]
MGLEDIFGKEIERAHELGDYYWDLADKHGLDHIPGHVYFLVLANKRLSEYADDRKKNTPPWPGIKIHSPLSEKMYNVLMNQAFQQMMINGEIDGIKVYLYEDSSWKHKEATIYVSLASMPNLGKLLDILKKNGISIQPGLSSYYHQGYKMVLLNRMVIDPYDGVFARYSTDFTGKMNISDIEIGEYMDKIDDHVWRVAADESIPRIVAVSRDWLLNNQYNLDEILRNSYASLKDFYYKLWETEDPKELLRYSPTIPTIYTFIKLGKIDETTVVAYPNIIISYDWSNKQLKAYDIFRAKIVKYDLSKEDDRERISNHPESELNEFLEYGTIS